MGWGVVWNSAASSLVIQNPPGAANWSIGTRETNSATDEDYGGSKRDLGPTSKGSSSLRIVRFCRRASIARNSRNGRIEGVGSLDR